MEIYLDNAATTRPETSAAMERHFKDCWYNPSCAYAPAEKVFIEIKETRELVKSVTGMKGRCVFTSGGTEANNTAIMSSFRANAHYITSAVEHPSVYNAFKRLEEMGASVDYIKPRNFCIYAQDVAEKVKGDTALVSIMHVNNETGALNDIDSIARSVKGKNPSALFHSDGVQALFKTSVELTEDIDYYTLSAHKIHALKGTGALLVKEGRKLKNLHCGGEQEYSLRPGTENTLGIQSFAEALGKGRERLRESLNRIEELRSSLLGFLNGMEDVMINLPERSVPHILSVSFPGVRAEVLVRLLGEKGIYIGTGAACSRGKLSRVLLESGLSRETAQSTVRISMSRLTTVRDIEVCAQGISDAVKQLRRFGRR